MPYDASALGARRIAVIGGGISGMGAAHRLAHRHRVTLFEAAPRLGGHACTVVAGERGDQPVDIGFIVFNHATYPRLTALFHELGVETAPSAMTFGCSIGGGRLEYALRDLNGLFAQRRNALRPGYWRMLRDILRFSKEAHRFEADDSISVADMLAVLRTGPEFRDHYLLPFSGAIWSTPTDEVMDFPAAALVRFFRNHRLLEPTGQHQWYTVRGGSIEYVSRLQAALVARGVNIDLGRGVETVRRVPGGVELRQPGGDWQYFDEVVFATHSDDSFRMLADPSAEERASVGAIAYQPNDVVLHSDTRIMPRRRAAWASWVYTEDRDKRSPRIDLTYWMNSLQPIPADDPLFVTLNTARDIDPAKVHHATVFRHPVYDRGAMAAQARVHALNGTRNTWFCGAWLRNGFHEDGLATACEVADALTERAAKGVAA